MDEQEASILMDIFRSQRNAAMDEIARQGVIIKKLELELETYRNSVPAVLPEDQTNSRKSPSVS